MEPKLLGVCLWIAQKLALDVNIIRIGFAVLTILGIGTPIIAYLVIFVLLRLKFIE
ncbi:MAG: PspC domain-containing protein [Breznakibacter sp.]|nr:PspC domain-containing protein [Breznakibacter sp.]